MYNIEGNKLCYFIIFSAWKDCFCLTKKTKKQVNCWHPFSVLLLNVLLCNQNLKDKIDWWMYLLLPCSIDRPLVTPYLITGIDRAVFEGGGLWPQTLLWIAWLSLPSHQGSHTAFAQPCHTPLSSRLLLFMKSTLTDYYLKVLCMCKAIFYIAVVEMLGLSKSY